MMDEMVAEAETEAVDQSARPGALLRHAREAKGMSIADVAEVTRVAQRQLEAIERSDFRSLPGTPYAVGFARAYARAVGMDEVAVARGVREELGTLDPSHPYEAFEPLDPARIPPRRLAWIAATVALVLAVGYGVWRTQFFAASTDQEISDLSNRASEAAGVVSTPAKAPESAPVTGPVVLTAIDNVWLRIYDQAGTKLLEREMAKGESYTVPAAANNPMILTGRPDAIAVSVGGKPVAPLGSPEKTIADVPISAAALLARAPALVSSAAPSPVTVSQQTRSATIPVSSGAAPATPNQPAVKRPAQAEGTLDGDRAASAPVSAAAPSAGATGEQ